MRSNGLLTSLTASLILVGTPASAVVLAEYEFDDETLETAISLYYKQPTGQWQPLTVNSKVDKPRFDYMGMSFDETKFYFSSDFDDPKKPFEQLKDFGIYGSLIASCIFLVSFFLYPSILNEIISNISIF